MVISGFAAYPMAALTLIILAVALGYVAWTAIQETGIWRILFLIGIAIAILSAAGMLPQVDGDLNFTGFSKPIISRNK